MSKGAGGSLPRGRRVRHELPAIPAATDLPPLEAKAQRVLRDLVERAGGRYDSRTSIPIGHLDTLVLLLDAWGRRHAVSRPTRLYFSGQPGLWHALDELYPLQGPNRWDRLRQAVISELEKGAWRRRTPPRGIAFDITD